VEVLSILSSPGEAEVEMEMVVTLAVAQVAQVVYLRA